MKKFLVVGALGLIACQASPGVEPEPEEAVLATLVVEATDSSLVVEQTATLSAKGRDQNGDPIDLPSDPVYSVSPTSVATVSGNLVNGADKGTATVTATVGNVSGTLQVGVSGRIHDEDITASETWAAADNPHIVKGQIGVGGAATPTLTIQAGVEVRFAADAGLMVGGTEAGTLKAAGTATAPIRLIAHASAPQPGFWRKLSFWAGSGASELRNVTLSHCGGGPGNAACLSIDNGSKPIIETVTIQNSGGRGVVLAGEAAFNAGSTGLTVTGSVGYPIQIQANFAGTIPTGGSFSANNPNAVLIESDNVATTQTWPNLGIPYVISGDTRVQGAGTPVLTLVAGTELRFASGEELLVGDVDAGVLVAQGTVSAPVKFTADAASPTAGFWRGIHVRQIGSSATRLTNTIIEFCGSGPADACLTMSAGAKPVIDNVTIRNSIGFGVVADEEGAFGAGSTSLSVTGTAKHPVSIQANYAGTLPTGGTFSGNTLNAVLIESDNVATTQTWPNLGIPYVISGDTRVSGAGTPVLTLPAGTELRFASGQFILIGDGEAGALVVQGTAAAPVKFTADAATPSPGHWRALNFNLYVSGATRIDYAIFEFGGGFGDGLVVVRKELGGFITNSVFRSSSACGVWADFAVTTDFTAAGLGNSFSGNAGANQCGP